MSTSLQIRDVGTQGVNKDSSDWQNPLAVWTDCLNVRFTAGTVSHAGVWKAQADFAATVDPIILINYHRPTVQEDAIMVVSRTDNTLYEIKEGLVTPRGQIATDGPVDAMWTWTVLADVLYVNRADVTPFYVTPTADTGSALTNMGTPAWTCAALRSYKDFLIALNITTGSASVDNEVKWSDAALAGQIPANWGQDQTVSSLGGSNILAEMNGPIVDGATLGDVFLIYGRDEVWRMEFIDNGTYPFTFSRAINTGGAKSVNCIVEAGGYHYVLGRRDIYRTDGVTRESLSQGILNDWFFGNEFTEDPANPCFVAHYEQQGEIFFFYQSRSLPSGGIKACNRALVFNYITSTWSIISAPYVSYALLTVPLSKFQWDTIVGTWDQQTMEWDLTYSAAIPVFAAASRSNTEVSTSRLVAYDNIEGPVSGPILEEINENPFLERTGIKLDAKQGASLDVQDGLFCQQVYPLLGSSAPVSFTLGQSFSPSGAVTVINDAVPYDPATDWKVDTRVNGRFMSLRIDFSYTAQFKFSGYDLLITDGGAR